MTSKEHLFPQSLWQAGRLPKRSDLAETLCVIASITNLRDIERAWGRQSALAVRHIVLERARELCRSVPGISVLSGDQIVFVFDLPLDGLGSAEPGSARIGLLLDRILGDLADQPIGVAADVVFAALSVSVVEQVDSALDVKTANVGAGSTSIGQDEQRWRERFFSDMKAAERLFSARDADRLLFDAEAVCNLRNLEVVRYYEMVPFWTWDGVRRQVVEMVAPLERLGLLRRMDRWAVETAICALQSNPGVSLACNVTSHSASLDAWWTFITAVLSGQRAVAERLVIELSEVTRSIDLERVGEFVRGFQALGCRVALDNVGGGNSSIEALASLGADVVKIDAGRLHEARESKPANDFLRNLVTLARGVGADVVITGVEDEADVEIAELAGATHIQGPHFHDDIFSGTDICIPD